MPKHWYAYSSPVADSSWIYSLSSWVPSSTHEDLWQHRQHPTKVDADKGGKLIKLIPEDKVQQIFAQGLEPCWNLWGILWGFTIFGTATTANQPQRNLVLGVFSSFFLCQIAMVFSRLKQCRIVAQGWCNLRWFLWKLLNCPGQRNLLIVRNIGIRIVHVVSWDHFVLVLENGYSFLDCQD